MLRSVATAALLSFALGAMLSPAAAITRQSAPARADGSARLVDPDARAERLTDRTRRSTERAYRRTTDERRLVAPTGPAADSFGGRFAR